MLSLRPCPCPGSAPHHGTGEAAAPIPHPRQSQGQQHGWCWGRTFQIWAASPFHSHRGKTHRASSPRHNFRKTARTFPRHRDSLLHPPQCGAPPSTQDIAPERQKKNLAGSPGLALPPSCSRFMWLQRLSHFQRHTNPANGCLTAHCVCSDTAPLPRKNNSERVWMRVYTKRTLLAFLQLC